MRASLIQILFSVRSERQLMEQMQYNLLFRWFVGLGVDDPVWVPTVFTKNRDRLLTTDMSRKFLGAILAHREVAPLLSDEHFSVDGTLIKAWASMKSVQPKPTVAPPDDGGLDGPPAAAPDRRAEQPAPEDPQTADQANPEPAAESAPEAAPMQKPDAADPRRLRPRAAVVDNRQRQQPPRLSGIPARLRRPPQIARIVARPQPDRRRHEEPPLFSMLMMWTPPPPTAGVR
jgi:hypothetical protein